MFRDLRELLSVFNAHSVKYLVVGGYAVSFHSQPRATKDTATHAALQSFGAPLSEISVEDLANPSKFFRFGREPVAFDILPRIDGVEFDSAWSRRVEGTIDEEAGLKVFFISKQDLIAAKIAAGRMRDLADVEEIRKSNSKRGEN